MIWLGLVAAFRQKTSTAMVRCEEHKRFHDWASSASNPRALRGTGIGKLHCQVSTEEGGSEMLPIRLLSFLNWFPFELLQLSKMFPTENRSQSKS